MSEKQSTLINLSEIPRSAPPSIQKAISLSNSSGFLPFISLVQGNTKLKAERDDAGKPKFHDGDWALGGKTNMGTEWVGIPIFGRPHAKYFRNREVVKESYDPDSPDYAEIVVKAEQLRVSKNPNEMAFAGVEFLFWLPEYGTFGQFMFKNTSLQIAEKLYEHLGRPVKISATPVVSKSYSWITPEMAPIPANEAAKYEGKLPTSEQLESAVRSFKPASGPQEVEVVDKPNRPNR